MNKTTGINRYQETDLGSIGPEKMIVLLYEKTRSCLEKAQDQLAAGNHSEFMQRASEAQRIVVELRNALDHGIGGEITLNLETIYDFCFREILAAMTDHDPAHLQHCLRVTAPLLEAWTQIPPGTAEETLRQLSRHPAAPGQQPGADPARDSLPDTTAAPPSRSPNDPGREVAGGEQHHRPRSLSLSA